jgi:hypothetical protein
VVLSKVANPAATKVMTPRYVKPDRKLPVRLLRYPTMSGAK